MARVGAPVTILVADDDADDREMLKEAFEDCHLANDVRFVEDGQQLLDYLRRGDGFGDPARFPMPGVILLDLNMPRVDGREALRAIKSDPLLRRIPVVVFTTSRAEEDILKSYDLGANSFIRKPVTLAGIGEVVGELDRYWLQIVELPDQASAEAVSG